MKPCEITVPPFSIGGLFMQISNRILAAVVCFPNTYIFNFDILVDLSVLYLVMHTVVSPQHTGRIMHIQHCTCSLCLVAKVNFSWKEVYILNVLEIRSQGTCDRTLLLWVTVTTSNTSVQGCLATIYEICSFAGSPRNHEVKGVIFQAIGQREVGLKLDFFYKPTHVS